MFDITSIRPITVPSQATTSFLVSRDELTLRVKNNHSVTNEPPSSAPSLFEPYTVEVTSRGSISTRAQEQLRRTYPDIDSTAFKNGEFVVCLSGPKHLYFPYTNGTG